MRSYTSPMTDCENHALALLRRIDERTARLEEDLNDIKSRLSAMEHQYATQSYRLDRFETRLARIERRLDLSDASQH